MILQDIQPQCDALYLRLREAKEASHKTLPQIAAETGVPESTVNKFFSGHLSSPSVYHVAAYCLCLGVSMDSLFGCSAAPEDAALSYQLETAKIALAKTEEQVALLQQRSDLMVQELNRKEQAIKTVRDGFKPLTYGLCGLSILLALFLLVYICLDASNPDLGLIRAYRSSPLIYIAALSIAAAVLYIGHTMVKKRMERKKNDNPN